MSSHSKIRNSPFIESIKQMLVKKFEDENQNFVWTKKALNQMHFSEMNGLMSIVDAGLTDRQVQFFVEKISDILRSLMISEDFIKGINFNGNLEITDQGLKLLINFLS